MLYQLHLALWLPAGGSTVSAATVNPPPGLAMPVDLSCNMADDVNKFACFSECCKESEHRTVMMSNINLVTSAQDDTLAGNVLTQSQQVSHL